MPDDNPATRRTLLQPETLRRLATSDTGFVFDPVTGDSFSANGPALAILRLAQTDHDPRAIATALAREFDVTETTAERDILEFAGVLRRVIA